MAKKIYTTQYSKLSITLEHNGITAKVEFSNGRMGEGIKAKFITSDPFLQYLIEHDSRYGSLFRLERTIEDVNDDKKKEEKKKDTKKAVDSVHDLSDAIDYLSTLGKTVRTRKQVMAVAEELGITFPNLKD